MESVAAARRPVIDNVHGAAQPQDELGPGMLVPRLWSPDSCLEYPPNEIPIQSGIGTARRLYAGAKEGARTRRNW